MIELSDRTIDRAIAAGLAADRLGRAFVGGYHAALSRLVGSARDAKLSLAATEKGGARPRDIRTTFANGKLNGEKTFATLASAADEILVVASIGESDGKNNLVLVRVTADAPGLTIADRAPL